MKRMKTRVTTAPQGRPFSLIARHHFAAELSELVRLATTMVFTQLGQIAMIVTDLAFIGRLGPEAVAAAGLASRVYIVGFMLGMGLMTAIALLAAEAFGADNLAIARTSLRMGLWAALLVSVPIMMLPLRGEQILLALGQAPVVAQQAQEYLLGLGWGVGPALCFVAIRSFMGAFNRPEPILWITLAAIPVNAFLGYVLIFGTLGLPRLELLGAGVATSLVNCATLLAALWFTTMCRPFRDYHLLSHLWRFNWPSMRQLFVTGVPISISILLDSVAFSAATILMGMIGTSALAAHHIAFQVYGTLMVIPIGVSMAAAVRVAQAVGRNDRSGTKRAGLIAMLVGIVASIMLTVVVVKARVEITMLFLEKSTTGAEAADLVSVGASFFISYAIYIIALGSLRGLRDTQMPLLFVAIGYWIIGLSLSYVLGLRMGFGAVGIWIGMSLGTAVCAALLVLRFHLLTRRLADHSRCGSE
ncbi:MATE family efflux transporter [Bradyrhizobium sp. WSM2254]|uniref:MATE family efflux transporter n=1 Tax=Bradyrhizobium sp. WSM2254 TaxID=1188263 RepID=UPI001FDA96CE|nr:MATE family efflux transporter [Bradyrhizobium sp. WSM2254]